MENTSVSAPPTYLGLALKHFRLHMALGAMGSVLLNLAFVLAMEASRWGPFQWNSLLTVPHLVTYACIGAFLVGLLRVPVMARVMQRAQRQQWPVWQLLLASAALFLAPILPVFLFGETWRMVGKISFAFSIPFFIAYLVAAYRLRGRIYAPPQVA